jgi:hypothetical protein
VYTIKAGGVVMQKELENKKIEEQIRLENRLKNSPLHLLKKAKDAST